MGGSSGKWLKSLITLKKSQLKNDQEKVSDRSKKKWRLWRSSSEGFEAGSSMKSVKKGHVARSDSDEAFTTAIATVVRAPPKDFMIIKKEWAAIRIQAAFRGLLSRRALRALKAVVRLQAIFRGRQVRKQAAVTLRCMQALVRVQARARARSVSISSEGKKSLDEHSNQELPMKQAERGWCDSPGTVDEVRAKLQTKKQAAIKRERVIQYSLSQQQLRGNASPNSETLKAGNSIRNHRIEKGNSGFSWLERWMAAKPWDSTMVEEIPQPDMTAFSRKSEDNILSFHSYPTKHDTVKVRRNNMTTRISATPITSTQLSSSSSGLSSGCLYDDSPASTSWTSASPTVLSYNTAAMERMGEKKSHTPSYMNLTESTKVKQRACRCFSHNVKTLEDCLSQNKSMATLNGDTRSTTGSIASVNMWKDAYPSPKLGKHNSVRDRRFSGR